jgi:predicted nucleotidyltransferase
MGGPLGDLEPYQQALDEAFERHGVVLAYLYGSQTRGDAGPLSDVDVAVQFTSDVPRRERLSRVGRLASDLCQLLRRDDVYVVDLDAIPPLLCHRIYLNHRLLCCPDDTVRVAFETRALRQYVATRPLRRIRWRYVTRRITQGRYGRLESEAQTMVDKVYEHLQRTPDDIRFFAHCIVEYLERKGHLFL